jgi:hypothetical protein
VDRFDAMHAFVHVVESGSYTKAALQLNLHKATVSQQIQQLEDKLGTRLLTRTTRSVAPTEEGLAYYQHAWAILQQVDEMETQLRRGTSAPAGHLRVECRWPWAAWYSRRKSAASWSATRPITDAHGRSPTKNVSYRTRTPRAALHRGIDDPEIAE